MDLPIRVKNLMHLLPHRPPMVWIDQVSEVGDNYQSIDGTCTVELKPDALYMAGPETLRGSAVVEFTAQSFGYLKAAYQVMRNISNPPEKTYLTGVRSCQADFSQVSLKEIKTLDVKISVLREIKPLTFVRGEIYKGSTDELLGFAEIQVYVD